MSVNEEELLKIKEATTGWLKGNARRAIRKSLLSLMPKIERAKALPNDERDTLLKQLLIETTETRQRALQDGANSYGDPAWAAAAACETWLHELVVFGTDETLPKVEALIDELSKRS